MADGFQRVVIPYRPRPPFAAFHARRQRWSSMVVHRRGGKTVASLNDLQRAAVTNTRKWPPPRYAYIAPYYNQAKRIAWGYAKHYADPIPGREFNEGELKITYPNGAELRLFGADNPDSLRGDYLDGVVPDEYGDWAPTVWPLVIRPMLSDYQGWAAFIGTPKGKNAFYELHTAAERDPENWFTMTLRASESGLIPPDELEELRRGMSANQFRQEFECDFDAAIKGAYYAELLHQAKAQRRIKPLAIDPLMALRSHHDIGGRGAKADAYSIWITQWVGPTIKVVDHYSAQGQPLSAHVNWMRDSGYGAAEIVLPHDGDNEGGPSESWADAWRKAQFKSVRVIPNQGPGAAMYRIEQARRWLPRTEFDDERTQRGRNSLAQYAPKYREDGMDMGPNHNEYSHDADAFGLMMCDYREPKDQPVRRHAVMGTIA